MLEIAVKPLVAADQELLYEALYHPRLRIEVNYVLEDNVRMNNALRNLAVKPLRRYRVYEMPIAS